MQTETTKVQAGDVIEMGGLTITCVSARDILHRNGAGVLITRVLRLECNGKLFDQRYWHDWSAPGTPLHHIDQVDVA